MSKTPRSVPPTASTTSASDGDKLHAPSAALNVPALQTLLQQHAPARGRALELASGTGQHVARFAQAMPDLVWQPTDLDPARLRSIDAYVAEAALPNLRPALRLDATQSGWASTHPDQDLIVLINLLHLISAPEAEALIAEAAAALAPGGMLVLYGPFKRNGQLTSDGDQAFHSSLIAHDPAIGYKDKSDITRWLAGYRLEVPHIVEMPANNLAFVAVKPAA